LVTLLESGRLRLWPLPGGEPSDLGGDHGQAALDLSPDGEQVAVAGDDGIVRIWSTETDAALGEFGHEEAGTEVLDVTFSHDGLSILTLWADSSIDVRVPNSRWTDEEVRETGSNRIIAASLGPGREFQHLNADWTFRGGYINQRRYDVDGVVETAAFNSRGTSIVAVSSDGVAWSLPVGETGEPESLPAEVGRVRKVAISDDDRWIVTASADSTVRVIESDGGAGVVIRVGGAVTDVAISPDGSRLATAAADSSVQIWDRGGDLLRSLPHPAKVNSIAFRADGHRLISAGEDGAARIWDVSSGQRLSQLIHNGPIRSAGFSRDGTLVFTVGMDSVSRIWEPPSGWTIQARLGGAGSAVLGAAMLRDGETVVSLTDRGAVRRSPALGGQDEWMLGSASQNGSSWLRPNGEYVASVTNGGRIHLWRTDAPASLRVLERGPGPVSSVAFRPELRFGPESGQVLSAGADGSIRAWSIAAGDTLAIDGSGKGPVVLSPDGSRAASWDPEGLVLVRSISSGDTVAIFSAGVVERMAFSPNGARIATVGRDATLRVWTLGGESVAAIAGFEEGVSKIEFDRAGRRIATVEPNGEVRVWSAATGHSLWRGGGGARRIRAVTFSPDGDSILTGDEHGVITVRSTRNWDSISALPAHSGAVSAIAFSTKGILASGGANGTLRVFSTGSREEVAAFRGHTDAITDLRFTPNGERLVTGSLDGTVRVWAVGPRALQWLAKGGLPIGLRAADLPQALTEDERADLVERR
jgi:WD40 repeat protein